MAVSTPSESPEDASKKSQRTAEASNGYLGFLLVQTGVSAACNALHHSTERAAKWILLTHDRVPGDTFDLKQEFFAVMLGLQRPPVSIAAGTLQQAGFITYRRGRMTVVDR